MNYNDLYIVIIISAIVTFLFKLIPLFINLNDENKYVDTFFTILPISIITILVFPEIFTSIGTCNSDVVITLITMLFISYLTIKNISLGLIAILSVVFLIILREVYFGIL